MVPGWKHAAEWARAQDTVDPLAAVREEFELPPGVVYACGHSLGPLPRRARDCVTEVLDTWSALAVEGHFRATPAWAEYSEPLAAMCAGLIGANADEVAVFGSLTANLHLLLATFYRPQGRRRKILIERPAFPSDRYAVVSQIRWHGLDPAECLLQVRPEENLGDRIAAAGPELALALLGGVNYYSGQALDLAACTRAAHAAGAVAGFDLAHAIGNIEIQLRASEADFAVWCGYKYLNGGPGAPAGIFIHERHHGAELPRLAGWWANRADTRFEMREAFEPAAGAAGWSPSSPSVLALAGLRGGLEIFEAVPRALWLDKSRRLQAALSAWTTETLPHYAAVTPARRGAQISLHVGTYAAAVQERLRAAGVVSDARGPILRMSFHPLYSRFQDVVAAVTALGSAFPG